MVMMSPPLDKGERLYVWRTRKGLTQEAAALWFSVPERVYRRWESGSARSRACAPRVFVGRVELGEMCRIIRRRANKTQQDVASELGVSRVWVVQMEQGEAPVARLARHWGILS